MVAGQPVGRGGAAAIKTINIVLNSRTGPGFAQFKDWLRGKAPTTY